MEKNTWCEPPPHNSGETAGIKRPIIFSKCDQFHPTGSKLSAACCTKSHRSHQIHANPSLHHGTGRKGGGGVSSQSLDTQTQAVHQHTTWWQSLALGLMRWKTHSKQCMEGLEHTPFWLWPHSGVWDDVKCKFKGLCKRVGALLACLLQHTHTHKHAHTLLAQLLPWEQWASFFYSAHATNYYSCVDVKDKIPPPAHWACQTTILHVLFFFFFFFFRACFVLSAAGDTRWWKPQETWELTESLVRAYSTIS